MTTPRKKPRTFATEPEELPTDLASFAAAATSRLPAPVAPEPALDPKAKPTTGINLRLNEYQLDLARRLAEKEGRSIQQTIKRLLVPAMERALEK